MEQSYEEVQAAARAYQRPFWGGFLVALGFQQREQAWLLCGRPASTASFPGGGVVCADILEQESVVSFSVCGRGTAVGKDPQLRLEW